MMTKPETTALLILGNKLEELAVKVAEGFGRADSRMERIETWSESIDNRLEKLNGSVARHEGRFVDVMERFGVVERAAEVFRVETRSAQDKADAAQAAADKVARKYQGLLRPVVKVLAAGLGVLLLEHWQEILKAIKGL